MQLEKPENEKHRYRKNYLISANYGPDTGVYICIIDFEKAFDRVQHLKLVRTLQPIEVTIEF